MHDIANVCVDTALQPARGASTIPESPRKNWLMKRNCSLSPRQVGWFTLSVVISPFTIATFFAWQGVWLVLPFAGLEVAILGWALLYYARHASDYEHVWLDEDALVIEQAFASRWVRHVSTRTGYGWSWRNRCESRSRCVRAGRRFQNRCE